MRKPPRMQAATIRIALATAMIAAAFPAAAARPDTRAMTCEQARAFVRSKGAVVMTTGPHTYDRIVSSAGFCDSDEETWVKVAPTRDDPNCRVGSYCRTRVIDPLWRLWNR